MTTEKSGQILLKNPNIEFHKNFQQLLRRYTRIYRHGKDERRGVQTLHCERNLIYMPISRL